MLHNENYFNSFDGTRIYYKKDLPHNIKGIVLIVHGIAEHCGRYEYVKDYLVQNGYGVYRFDNRGHGKSEGKRGDVSSFKDFIKDTDCLVDIIKKEHSDKALFILGHSMGGFIAACYGIAHGDKIRGEILSGAPTLFIPFKTKIKSIKFPYVLWGRVPNIFYDFISKDPKVISDYKADTLVLKTTSARLNLQISGAGTKWIKNNIKSYKCSCLIIHGKDDRIVPYENSMDFYSNISCEDKEIKIYEGLYHEILNEECRDNILGDICHWLHKSISNLK